jgi:hypothetical protein
MKMLKVFSLSIFFLQISVASYAQYIFYTYHKYNIDWRNEVFQSNDVLLNGIPCTEKSFQVKWDIRQMKLDDDNPIVDFLYGKILAKKQKGLTRMNGEELTPDELINLAYWKKNTLACTGEEISSYNREEIKFLKIHQQWTLDTVSNTLKNKVLGLTPVRIDEDKNEIEMFYLPMENEIADYIMNQNTVVYIRFIYKMFSFDDIPKDSLLDYICQNRNHCQLTHDVDDIVYSNADSTLLIQEIKKNMTKNDKAFCENLRQFSQGIGLKQLLYIDLSKGTINTTLSAISPVLQELDAEINFRCCIPFCWLDVVEND